MKNPTDPSETGDALRDRLIGLGERSFRKSYYPQLQKRLNQLERFRSLLDLTTDLIFVVEQSTRRIVDANASACRQLGYSDSEITELLLEQVLDLEPLSWEEALGGSGGKTVTTVLRGSDGAQIPAEISLVRDMFEGEPYVIAVARDVAERQRAEELLRKSESEKALILESTEELVLFHDRDMRIVWGNRASGRSVGLTTEALKNRCCWEVWHGRNRPCASCPVLGALKTGTPQKGEVVSPDGRVWFIRGYPVRNELGEVEGVVEFCLDITERKRAEEALRDSDRMKAEFISIAAHELRTPLTAIQGFSQLLLTQPDLTAEEQKEFLSHINHKAVALADLVAEMLDISRVETGGSLALKKVRSTPRDLLWLMEPFLEAQLFRHRLVLGLEGESTAFEADREKMSRVFENLISNAVKYSPEESPIRIAGKPAEKGYEFTVSDRGIGMTPQQVEKIFDKFYRADNSNTAIGGIGLGMSIVRNIIEAHGGSIGVESVPGEGTTVRFTLPLLEEEDARDSRKG